MAHRTRDLDLDVDEQVLEYLLRLARHVSACVRGEVPPEDLVGAGAVELAKVRRAWRPDGGASLGTYCWRAVRHAMFQAVRLERWPRRHVSIDQPAGDELDATLGDLLLATPPAESERSDRIARRVLALELLASLPPRERLLLRLRCFMNLSSEETGRALGVSPQRASVIEDRALCRLRRRLVRSGVAVSAPLRPRTERRPIVAQA